MKNNVCDNEVAWTGLLLTSYIDRSADGDIGDSVDLSFVGEWISLPLKGTVERPPDAVNERLVVDLLLINAGCHFKSLEQPPFPPSRDNQAIFLWNERPSDRI